MNAEMPTPSKQQSANRSPISSAIAPSAALDAVAYCASETLKVPLALVFVIDGDCRQTVSTTQRLDAAYVPPIVDLAMHAISHAGPLVVEDARQDRRLSELPAVASEPGIRFYASAPLTCPEGRLLGKLFVMDLTPRKMSTESRDALCVLAKCAARVIVDHRRVLQDDVALHITLEQIERRHQARGLALTDIGQELRTPLSAIIGFAELMERDFRMGLKQYPSHLNSILDCSRYLSTLASTALGVAGHASAEQSSQSDCPDLRLVLGQAAASVRPRLEEEGIRLVCHLPDGGIPSPVDEPVLQEIVLIMLSSAEGRTAKGGLITLSAQTEEAAVLLKVTCESIGPSRDSNSAVSAAFQSAATDTLHSPTGGEADLSFATRLVELLGGVLSLDTPGSSGFSASARLPREARRSTDGRNAALPWSDPCDWQERDDGIL